jgi:hypothetical protein
MYTGASCPYRPFSNELGDVEINTRIYKVQAHGADLNPMVSPAPFREGVNGTRVSLLKPVFGCLRRFQFLNVLMFLCRVSGVLAVCHEALPCPRTW